MSVRQYCCGAFAALTLVALGGCANNDYDTSAAWFAKPLDLFGSKGGYTYSNLTDSTVQQHAITSNDLIDANGACPAAPPARQPQPQPQTANAAPASGDMVTMLGGGVAIGMTECEAVSRLGQPTAINLTNNGYRSLVLTYNGGPRPGVYRFRAGRLAEMDRVEAPPTAEPPKKNIAKKKSTKPKDPANAADKT